MKRNVVTAVFLGVFLSLVALPFMSRAEDSTPMIRSIEIVDQEIVITVSIPSGLKRVTLEGRRLFGRGVWIPRGVKHTDGDTGNLVFRLPNDQRFEVFRVKGETHSPLPVAFFTGESEFPGQKSETPPPDGSADSGIMAASSFAVASDANQRAASDDRTVVESDIYQLNGDRLYFFNQYRGLQVIDVHDPDAPAMVGTLTMPLAGEQMYLLPNQLILLLAHDNCNWWSSNGGGEVILVDASSAQPTILNHLPVHGRIKESSLVGSALYVASEYYRQVPEPAAEGSETYRWEWGTHVMSFDFSDPDHPVARDDHWFPGYGNVLHATPERLFVSVRGVDHGAWWQSEIRIFDISNPDGSMIALGDIRPAGRVMDKFKMDLSGDTFTVISETSQTVTRATHVETFDVSDASRPVRLGGAQVGFGESLFATRFDGDKAYIVTYRRIDPLWIVDLSDPTNPQVRGELEVPGWSTYMQPLGDRLLTIGVDDQNGWKVAVSLFDVSNPGSPSLLSRVPLGDHYSWSEANHDEKAFGFLKQENLILVPFEGSDAEGHHSRVQLIDLAESSLVKRGAIDHVYRPRRSLMHRDRILSLSGRELIATDATDRDNPVVRAELELIWSVDQVVATDEHLLEIEYGQTWNKTSGAVRIASVEEPDESLHTLRFEGSQILGSTRRNGTLYLATAPLNPDADWFDPDTAPASIPVSIHTYDLASLPRPIELGVTTTELSNLGWNAGLEPLWPADDLLVWRKGGAGYNPFARGLFHDFIWFPRSVGNRFLAFSIAADRTPVFRSDHTVAMPNAWWIGGNAIPVDGRIYLSPQSSVYAGLNDSGFKTWEQKNFLQVLDYGDPASPTERMKVDIPGELIGVSHNGSVLYTRGHHWKAGSNQQDYTEWLDASAYDGVQASLLDSIPLGKNWPNPALVDRDGRIVAVSSETSGPTDSPTYTFRLNTWRLDGAGRFARVGQSLIFDEGVHELASIDDLLLARVGQSHRVIEFIGDEATEIANEPVRGCFWTQLRSADGNRTSGIWLPLNDYGLISIPLPQYSASR